jgi:multiple sugar transport system substrate-binding protein
MKKFTLVCTFFAVFGLMLSVGVISLSAEECKLILWDDRTGPVRAQTEELILKPFREQYKCQIDYVQRPTLNNTQTLIAAVAAGNPPDVAFFDLWGVPVLRSMGALLNIWPYNESVAEDHRLVERDYTPAVWHYFRPKPEVVDALPGNITPLVYYYNKKYWREAGLTDKDIPKSWEEFVAVAKKLNKDTDGDGKIDRFAYTELLGGTPRRILYRFQNYLIQAGGWWVDQDGNPMVNTPEAQRAMQHVVDMIHKHQIISPSALSYNFEDTKNLFTSDRIAMLQDGAWLAGSLNREYPDVEWGDFVSPAGPSGKTGTWLAADPWAAFNTTKFPKEAAHLVYWLVKGKEYLQISLDGNQEPTPATLKERPEYKPTVTAAAAEAMKTGRLWPPFEYFPNLFPPIAEGIQKAASAQVSVKEALEEANQKAMKIVETERRKARRRQ